MKKYLFLLALLALCLSLYSCKKDKDTTVPDPSDVYLTKWVLKYAGEDPRTWLMTYDSQNRLASISDGEGNSEIYSYNSDGTLHRLQVSDYYIEYHYLDGVLQYSNSHEEHGTPTGSDTTYYEFGDNGLLARKIEETSSRVYTYYSNNLLKMEVWQHGDGSRGYLADTTLYEWNENGNLTRETSIYLLYTMVESYTYDDKPNWNNAFRMPWELKITGDFFRTYQYSVNNNLQTTTVDDYNNIQITTTQTIEYNSWNYPSTISSDGLAMEFYYEKY